MSGRIDFRIDGRRLSAAMPGAGASFEVKSALGPAYRVSIAGGARPFDSVNRAAAGDGVFVLIDRKVLALYGRRLKLPRGRVFVAPAEEQFKTLGGVSCLLEFLDACGAGKSSTLLVIGGGIMQDAGGFAAAMYKRGMRWVFAPTTLLSMCDSCIGAKTGINFGSAKNQLGLFSRPGAVLIEPSFLDTLEHLHIRSGMGEILKMCVIGGPKAMDCYRRDAASALAREPKALARLTALSLSLKKAVVEADELECGIRKALNYGHTIGHALEALSSFRVPHGEAVALGMVAVNRLAVSTGELSSGRAEALEKDCRALCSGVRLPKIAPRRLAELVMKDKKNVGGKAFFVLPRAEGDIVFRQRRPEAALWRLLASSLESCA